jgi:hypothetical protein
MLALEGMMNAQRNRVNFKMEDRMRPASLLSTLVGAGALFALVPTGGYADTLHGYCAGVGQCIDNGTNSPTTNNPPVNFGFTTSPGPATGVLTIDVLVPNNEPKPASFAVTGTVSATATLFSATPWTSGFLDTYLGISASPSNPIGAYLPSTQALDPGATGFFVFQANLGTLTLQSPSNPNVSPLENISPSLPLASYIVGFFNEAGAIQATANSGAIFVVPGPVVGAGLPSLIAACGALLALARRRRKLAA